MTNQTNKKAPNNRGEEELELALRSIWLGKRDLFQTFPDETLTDEEQINDINTIRKLFDYEDL